MRCRDAKGTRGNVGGQGRQGIQGLAAVTMSHQVAFGASVALSAKGSGGRSVAQCPSGKFALGGGYNIDGDSTIQSDQPTSNGTAWTVSALDFSGSTSTITAWAVCVTG
jgi:hypothetical protein